MTPTGVGTQARRAPRSRPSVGDGGAQDATAPDRRREPREQPAAEAAPPEASRGRAPAKHGPPLDPLRHRVVIRPRLFEALASGSRVVYLSAPAGYGKSVLLRSWISDVGIDRSAAWLSVGRRESDPQGFWIAVLDSLRATPVGSKLIRAMTGGPDLDGWSIVERLLDDIALLREPLTLVIDDLHRLEASDALQQLELLLARAPERLRIVLMTRRDLRIGQQRLRVEAALSEIRADDLRFTADEARALFDLAGLQIPESALESLVEQTEGWAAGLRLAALALDGHDDPERFASEFSGRDRTVAEYLMSEVLDRQSEEATRLLLRTSVLERVNGALADRLCGGVGGEQMLMALERAGAFVVPVDSQQTWYRYHHLFADLLRLELRRTSPEEVPRLHRDAAEWFIDHGQPVEAVRHAQAAEDWKLGARMLSDSWFVLYLDGLTATMRELLAGFPPEMLTSDAELAAVAANAELTGGSLELAERHLTRASAALPDVPDDRAEHVRVMLALLRLAIAHRRNDCVAAAEQAAELLPLADAGTPWSLAVGDGMRAVVLRHVAVAEIWAGRLEEAERHLEHALVLARRIGRPRTELMALAYYGLSGSFRSRSLSEERCAQAMELARAHGWEESSPAGIAAAAMASWSIRTGQLAEAETYVQHAERALRADVDPAAGMLLASTRGLLERLGGSYQAALEAFDAAERMGQTLVRPHMLATYTNASRLETLIRMGQIERVQEALSEIDERARQRFEIAAVLAALGLAQEDPEAAVAALAVLDYERSMSLTDRRWAIHATLLEAIARDRLCDPGGAFRALERALELAESDGLVLPFLMSPTPDLLERYSRLRPAHAALIREILGLLAGRREGTHCGAAEPPEEPLSDSELRVLRYLPTNLQAPEIASELFLSVNTVRTHIRHVYVKLGVHRRADAVDRARGLGLLSSLARR